MRFLDGAGNASVAAIKQKYDTTLDLKLAVAQGYTNVLPLLRDGAASFAGNPAPVSPRSLKEF